jgi:adenylate kinase
MRLILVGPPGSGKGTQAKLLSQRLGLAHIATGDILREARRLGTPAGRKAAPFMDNGQLVPDDLVNEMVADLFRREDRPEHFVFDGYPRTLPQAAALDPVLRQQFLNIERVVVLIVDDEEVVRRISGRWICPKDQTPYHVSANPPGRPAVCDLCGTPLVQRPDDVEATVRHRQNLYHETTEGLIPFYREQGLVREVQGVGDIEAIYARIREALQSPG